MPHLHTCELVFHPERSMARIEKKENRIVASPNAMFMHEALAPETGRPLFMVLEVKCVSLPLSVGYKRRFQNASSVKAHTVQHRLEVRGEFHVVICKDTWLVVI